MKIAIIFAAALGLALSSSCGSKPETTVPPVQQDMSAK